MPEDLDRWISAGQAASELSHPNLQRIDSMNLRRQPLLGLLLAPATESNVDRYTAMFLVDYQPAVAMEADAGRSSARHNAPRKDTLPVTFAQSSSA